MRRPARRFLVVLIQGAGQADLSLGATPVLAADVAGPGGVARLVSRAGRAGVDQLLDHLAAAGLGRRGVEIDRRSVVLRSTWRSDEAVLHLLPRRAAGPADVTLLWLRDAAHAAATAGLFSTAHRDALRELETRVLTARALLGRDGITVEPVILTFAPLAPVARWFDPIEVLRRHLAKASFATLRLWRQLSHLRILCPSHRLLETLTGLIESAPLREHGRLLGNAERAALAMELMPGELILLPHEEVAFSASPVRAAPRYLPSPALAGTAALPWLESPLAEIDLEAACQALATEAVAAARSTPVLAADDALDLAPDLLTALREIARRGRRAAQDAAGSITLQ